MSNDTQVQTLTDFLLARIAEDEELWANAGEAGVVLHIRANKFSAVTPAEFPRRMRAECEAKRRIVTQYLGTIESRKSAPQPVGDLLAEFALQTLGDVLMALALPYADHPDFRDAWRA